MRVVLKDKLLEVSEIFKRDGDLILLTSRNSYVIRNYKNDINNIMTKTSLNLMGYEYEELKEDSNDFHLNIIMDKEGGTSLQKRFVDDLQEVINKHSLEGLSLNAHLEGAPTLDYVLSLSNTEGVITKNGFLEDDKTLEEEIINIENCPKYENIDVDIKDVQVVENLLEDSSFNKFEKKTEKCVDKATEKYNQSM